MRVTGSQPTDCAYTSAVTSVWPQVGLKPFSTERSRASWKIRALP